RHRVLLAGGPRRLPRAARGGAPPRPPAARPAARPLPPLGALAGQPVLAPEGHGDLERARGPPPAREREARLPRGEDAAPLRRPDLPDLGPPAELRGEHLLGAEPRGARPPVRAQADELPRAHAALRLAPPQLQGAAAALRRVVDAAPGRA